MDTSSLLFEATKLLNQGLLSSAEMMCGFCLSYLSSANVEEKMGQESTLLLEANELMGDILFAQKQFRRAANFYKSSINQRKINKSQKNNTLLSKNWIVYEGDAKVSYKECLCYFELKQYNLALSELENIPIKLRSMEILQLFVKLYKTLKNENETKATLKAMLLLNPFAVEAVEELISLNVHEREIFETIETLHLNFFQKQYFYKLYVNAVFQQKNCEFEKCHNNLTKLLNEWFPKNLAILTKIAALHQHMVNYDQACQVYQQIHSIDSLYVVSCAEGWVSVLFHTANEAQLNFAVNLLVDNFPRNEKSYYACGVFCALVAQQNLFANFLQQKNQSLCLNYVSALAFLDKALLLNPNYSHVYSFRGKCNFHTGNLANALKDYLQSYQLRRSAENLAGLIETKLAMQQFKDAAGYAKEMVQAFPRHHLSYHLLGAVLAKSSAGHGEAIKAFTKALKILPSHHLSATYLCLLYMQCDQTEDALQCARRSLQQCNCPLVRLCFAKALARHVAKDYHQALKQLQLCITTLQTYFQSNNLHVFVNSPHSLGSLQGPQPWHSLPNVRRLLGSPDTTQNLSLGHIYLTQQATTGINYAVCLTEATKEMDRIEGLLRAMNGHEALSGEEVVEDEENYEEERAESPQMEEEYYDQDM